MSDDLKSRVRAQFGASVESYATSDVHARGESLAALLELVEPRADWHVLDVATGAGHTALALAPHVARVTATDLTPGMVRKAAALAAARGATNVTASTADAEALPMADGTYDAVTCRLAFHHFPDPARALAEFARVLKRGGTLGITDNHTVTDRRAADYYNAYEVLRDPSHYCVYDLPRLREMIEGAGFRISATRELTKEFEFHAWADRQHVAPADKQRLLEMMRHIPSPLQPLFTPRWTEETMYFSLWETVIVAHRS